MALQLLSKSFSSTYAGFPVQIRSGGGPARLYATPRGGLVSKIGRVVLDATGTFAVYVDDSADLEITIFDKVTGNAVSTSRGFDPGGSAQLASIAAAVAGIVNPFLVNDVTRNSLNDATDAVEVTMATFALQPGMVRAGSVLEVFGLYENTNSASGKQQLMRINGTAVGGGQYATTNQSFGLRTPFHITSNTTLAFVNNGGVGTGSATGLLTVNPVLNDITTSVNTLTLTCRWTAANVAGEFIRLKHAKLIITY